MKTKVLLIILIALLSGCAVGPWAHSSSDLPDPQETTNSIEMNRFPKTAESNH